MAAELYEAIAKRHGGVYSREKRTEEMKRKFKISCDQVVLLNNQVEDIERRLELAKINGNKTFCYILDLKLSTLAGVRCVMHQYCQRLADRLNFRHEMDQRRQERNRNVLFEIFRKN